MHLRAVAATKTMIKRTEQTQGLKPNSFGRYGYAPAPSSSLARRASITPHIPVRT